jgi:hypothetical protein
VGLVGRAGFTENVFTENPDLDTPRVRTAMARAADRLAGVPLCHSHLDYGLPNAFDGGVIDWQHHGLAPLGYDVYPMLEIVPFKGGTKGYRFTTDQREHYLAALDQTALKVTGRALRGFMGEFLLVKCFFFLALMRPKDAARPGKHTKWQYRRALFTQGLEQYESSGAIHTDTFPTLAAFTGQAAPGESVADHALRFPNSTAELSRRGRTALLSSSGNSSTPMPPAQDATMGLGCVVEVSGHGRRCAGGHA